MNRVISSCQTMHIVASGQAFDDRLSKLVVEGWVVIGTGCNGTTVDGLIILWAILQRVRYRA